MNAFDPFNVQKVSVHGFCTLCPASESLRGRKKKQQTTTAIKPLHKRRKPTVMINTQPTEAQLTCDFSEALIHSHRHGFASEGVQEGPGVEPAFVLQSW